MIIVRCSNPDSLPSVPDWAESNDGALIVREGADREFSTIRGITILPFELDSDHWFGLVNASADFGGTRVVVFPKDQEREWRTRRAEELLETVGNLASPLEMVQTVEFAARIIGLDSIGLLARIKSQALHGESLEATFRRIWGEKATEPAE